MKHKIYFGVKLNGKIVVLTIFLILSLILVTIIRSIDANNLVINIAFYGLIVLNVLWAVALYGLYKTRIEISETEVHAPFYVWYPSFKISEDNIFFIKAIDFKDIASVEKQEIYDENNHKDICLLKLTVIDKYILCMLLDGYNQEEIRDIEKMIAERISK